MSDHHDEDKDEDMANVEDDEDMSSDESDDDDAASAAALADLDAKLLQNPYEYQLHIDKINLLKKMGELDGLRGARQKFSELYPLAPNLWLEWISDEKALASTSEEKESVCNLIERAVKDYVSVEVWLEYCQFIMGTTNGLARAPEIFERAIASAGLHVAKGSLLWEAYREFESAMLSMKPDSVEQREKVDKLFRRQLAIPLLDMESTYDEYVQWMTSEGLSSTKIDPNVERSYKAALVSLKKREKFETDLAAAEEDNSKTLELYDKYLEVELKDGNPTRIQCLYERRVTDHCLEPHVWLEYLEYLDRQIKLSTVSLPVYERSIRNCTWNADLWVRFMRAKERFGCEKTDILKLSEQALSSGFAQPTDYQKIWLAYIDYLRRRMADSKDEKEQFEKDKEELRLIFGRALEHVAPIGGDPSCTIARYWAAIEADRFRDLEAARNIWADILAVHGDKAAYWLEQAQLEKTFGDAKHIRRVFQRAIEKVQDFAEIVIDAWLQFEREEGTLEQFEDAELKSKNKMEKVLQIRAKHDAAAEEERLRQEGKVERKKQRDLDKRREKRREESQNKKRKFDGPEQDIESSPVKKPLLVRPDMPPPPAPLSAAKPVAAPPGFRSDNVAPKDAVAPPPGFKSAEGTEPSSDLERQMRTVFLSNLHFDVNEKKIEQLMSTSGKVVEVRLVKTPAGKSKGFAYVEFCHQHEAKSALSRDREMFEGRPVFISECDPEKKSKGGHQFKFGTGLEKNKLFVKELSRDTTKEKLEEVFSPYGHLKEVRLITLRNGHSKGLAFVEFEEEATAARALVKTDGMTLDGKVISVAISNPPAKRAPEPADVRALGHGVRDVSVGARGKGRSQLAFVPRALAVKPTSTVTTPSGNGSVPEAGKSNAEFRKMLLGKK